MDKYCLSTQDRSILRCPQTKVGEKYCKRHVELSREVGLFYDYNGASYENKKLIKTSDSVWIFINQTYKEKKEFYELANIMKPRLIKRDMSTILTHSFIKYNVFSSEAAVRKMYGKKWRNSPTILNKHLEKAKAFLGTFVYFTYHTSQIIKIQSYWRGYSSRNKTGFYPTVIARNVYMKNHIPEIKRLQRWFRSRRWKRSLVVSLVDFRKHFLVNEEKMRKIQRCMRKYLRYRDSRSIACPYTFQEPPEIPKQYRIVYKDVSTGNPHWRYYDLRCLYQDFNVQVEHRHTLREPSTRQDFPVAFVVEASEKIWKMTRLLLKDSPPPEYIKELHRRSFYVYLLATMDLLWRIRYIKKMDDMKCPAWVIVRKKEKLQQFYLKIAPILYRLARDSSRNDLEEHILFNCQRFFSVRMVMSANNEDELAMEINVLLMKVLVDTATNTDWFKLVQTTILTHIKEIME